MTASRRAPLLFPLLALCAGSGCSWTLDLDGYRSRTGIEGAVGSLEGGDAGATDADATPARDTTGPFRDYRFPRGAASFSVVAAEGLTSMATAGESLALTAGSFPTARGGTVEVAADGSFTFTPVGAPGTFWGTDLLEYHLPASVLRARITVYPDRLRLAELATSGAGFGIAGAEADDSIAVSDHQVASAGDVNGDGLEDIVLGRAGPGGDLTEDGAISYTLGRGAYVLFGTRTTRPVALAAPTTGTGFFIRDDGNPASYDSLGWTVSGAGDVNGDGLDDILVTSHTLGLLDTESDPKGAIYVVFGKADGADVDSSALFPGPQGGAGGSGGFVILGPDDGLLVGFSAAGAGDVNGDGLADVIVSALGLHSGGASGVFVVFGKVDNTPIQLSDIESGATDGFALIEETDGIIWGATAAGLGDVNGDGLADIAFGGGYLPTPGATDFGRSWVVLGRRESLRLSPTDLEADPSLGYSITGAADGDAARFVNAGGDVDGDGLDDVLVSAPAASNEELGVSADLPDAGVAQRPDGIVYVVRGQRSPSNIALGDLERGSADGFAISGFTQGVGLGVSIASGDIDADGHADVIVGARVSPTKAEGYVVFGSPEPNGVRLGTATSDRVLTIEGNFADRSGAIVASGADFNGDGFDELLLGASLYSDLGAPQLAGGAYVAFGWDVRGTLSGRGEAMIGDRSNNVFDLPAL
ncbi:MAG: hypothetical protein RL033_2707, partial [Pseudomonadota bacterium]